MEIHYTPPIYGDHNTHKESIMKRIIAIVRIVKVQETGEWQCKAYDQHNVRWPEADYFTDDKSDAQDTMRAMLRPAS